LVKKEREIMKKALVVFSVLMLGATVAFAGPFVPTLLKISAAPAVQYAFDGKPLNIPVTVSGTAAEAVFCVYTKGKAATIKKVLNGYLGWHYVNNVDTSIYISTPIQLRTGNNTVSWDGKDDDGKLVPKGDYTYYIWGFDYIGTKQKVLNILTPAGSGGKLATIVEVGQDGKPLANPIFYGRYGFSKWVIGNDPLDSLLIETTTVKLPSGWGYGNGTALQPDDYSFFYMRSVNSTSKDQAVYKMKWVPNGVSEFTAWGDNGRVFWSSPTTESAYAEPGCEIIGDYLWTGTESYHELTQALADLDVIDWRAGTLEKKIDMTDWWSDVEDAKLGAQLNGGPNGVNQRNGFLTLNCHCSCIKQMCDPAAIDDLDNFVIWTNQNGDYVLDKNFEETSPRKWACNDYNTAPYTFQLSSDSNLFSNCPSEGIGIASIGLMGPDGDGIGYFAYSGDTTGWKAYNIFCDNGGAYDGIYCDDHARLTGDLAGYTTPGTFYIAQDSIKGILSYQIGVAEAPAAFSVAQNIPNPFNPTTTISFILAKAGKVTVEVFNSAGQKVDTLVNGSMSAGSHSITWNAAKYSAGVYFYTVKSGNFSRTMKMTFLK
jgi:flagellar hook assembly protein FlgD